MGTKSTPNTPVAVPHVCWVPVQKYPVAEWNLKANLFLVVGKEFQLIYFLNDRSEWPVLFQKRILGVSKIHSGFTKTKDHQNPLDSSSTQPFLEQPLEPSEADPGLTSDQMTFPDLPLHGLGGRKDSIIP